MAFVNEKLGALQGEISVVPSSVFAEHDFQKVVFALSHVKEASNIFLLKLLFAVLFLASLNIREAEPNWAAIYNHGELLVGFKKNLIFFILCIFHYKVSKELSIFKFKN
jgi:NADH:ubiquinone oxidoreductase subunit H|tara:strand:+ start:1112 stop:1438 length:327 start_codon:yes stop_codon:yes gene_type:complete